MNYKTKPCERCWKEIKVTWWAKYCLQCRKERDIELNKMQKERQMAERRLKGIKARRPKRSIYA